MYFACSFIFHRNYIRGVARIFQRGASLSQSEGTHSNCHCGQDIVMAFSPPVVGCLVKKGTQRGGHEHPRTPLATPLNCILLIVFCFSNEIKSPFRFPVSNTTLHGAYEGCGNEGTLLIAWKVNRVRQLKARK